MKQTCDYCLHKGICKKEDKMRALSKEVNRIMTFLDGETMNIKEENVSKLKPSLGKRPYGTYDVKKELRCEINVECDDYLNKEDMLLD